VSAPAEGVPAVSAEQAIRESAEGVALIDVREEWEWQRGHAPDARLMPMGTVGERRGELPEGERILVVCHSGARSAAVTEHLREAGFDAVNVEGGMLAWRSAGGPIAV